MKALSIQQPWAWLILNAGKDTENRSWRLPALMTGQRIYVHAGLREDRDAYMDAKNRDLFPDIRDLMEEEVEWAWDAWDAQALSLGGIVGEVTITGCVTKSDSLWFQGPFGFVLADPEPYAQMIPCRGRLGFWEPDL